MIRSKTIATNGNRQGAVSAWFSNYNFALTWSKQKPGKVDKIKSNIERYANETILFGIACLLLISIWSIFPKRCYHNRFRHFRWRCRWEFLHLNTYLSDAISDVNIQFSIRRGIVGKRKEEENRKNIDGLCMFGCWMLNAWCIRKI